MAWSVHNAMPMPTQATTTDAIGMLDRPSSAHSLRAFFEPRTVAVIGAGRSRGSVGAEIFHNLVAGFHGLTIPINPPPSSTTGIARTSFSTISRATSPKV